MSEPRPPFISRPLTPDQQIKLQEDRRRQELRSDYLVPISVMWTPDVPEADAQAALQGVADVLAMSGQQRELKVFGSTPFSTGDYSSAQWYVAEAFRNQTLRRDLGYGPQLEVVEVQKLFAKEPWQQEPHWEVMIVGQDLTATGRNDYLNFVFGSTDVGFASSVQSVARISR